MFSYSFAFCYFKANNYVGALADKSKRKRLRDNRKSPLSSQRPPSPLNLLFLLIRLISFPLCHANLMAFIGILKEYFFYLEFSTWFHITPNFLVQWINIRNFVFLAYRDFFVLNVWNWFAYDFYNWTFLESGFWRWVNRSIIFGINQIKYRCKFINYLSYVE